MTTPENTSDTGSGAAAAPARETEQPNAATEPEGDAVKAREARVAELQERCSDGTYKVDADELSAKLIDKHLTK